MSETTPLLHNMSAPPKSVVKYQGLSGLATKNLPGGSGLTSVKYQGAAVFGRHARFALPPDFQGLNAREFLVALGVAHDDAADGPPERHLQALINQRAEELPLPEGCAVVPSLPDHPMPWPDPLAALAVLSKCTHTVWLKSKTPALSGAALRGAVSLLIPPGWVDRMEVLKP